MQNLHLLSRIIGNVLFLLTQWVDWVAWAYIAAYGKRALIRNRDQPPLLYAHACLSNDDYNNTITTMQLSSDVATDKEKH